MTDKETLCENIWRDRKRYCDWKWDWDQFWWWEVLFSSHHPALCFPCQQGLWWPQFVCRYLALVPDTSALVWQEVTLQLAHFSVQYCREFVLLLFFVFFFFSDADKKAVIDSRRLFMASVNSLHSFTCSLHSQLSACLEGTIRCWPQPDRPTGF